MADSRINKLSIYLIKRHVLVGDVLKKKIQAHKIEISNCGILFIAESKINPPSWIRSFFPDAEIDFEKFKIFNSYPSAVFLVVINTEDGERIFAITFGGGWQMIDKDAIEENFGFRTTLNLVEPKALKSISKKNMALVQKNSRENIGREGVFSDFGVDIEQDLIQSLVGRVKDRIFGSTATGRDSLHLSVDVNMNNVKERLTDYYKAYKSEEYKNNFSWIDKIKEISNRTLILRLNEKVVAAIREQKIVERIWLAIPETINWNDVVGFKYGNKRETVYPDLYLEDFKGVFAEENIDLDFLKRANAYCVSASKESNLYSWKVYKCLYAEIEDEGSKYVLNSGKWYLIDLEFFEAVLDDYANFPISDLLLPDCPKDMNELQYNKWVAENNENYICLDGSNIIYDVHSSIEFCDLYSLNKKIIYIKRFGNTAVLNNLFSQGVIAGKLFLSDVSFKKKLDIKIPESHRKESFSKKIKSSDYEIVFGIISSSDKEFLQISFFSKIALRSARKMLEAFGYNVSFKKIKSRERD
ncbi:MAG: DUF6119 family protein [Candidatus Paceibacterota bacterium]